MILLLTAVSICVLWCIYLRFSREGRLIASIPGPKGLPILGNAFLFLLPPDKLFQFSRHLYKTYKGIILLHSVNFRSVNVYDPQDIEKIFSTTKFNDKKVPYDFLRPWLSDRLLISNGIKWHRRRKMLTQVFHVNLLKKFVNTFVNHTEDLLQNIENRGFGTKVNLNALITHASFKIMCETLTGVSKQNSSGLAIDKYFKAIQVFGECAVKRLCRIWYFCELMFNLSEIGQTQKKVVEDIHVFTKNIIDTRRKSFLDNRPELSSNQSKYKNRANLILLDLLLEKETDIEIDEKGIREEIDTFLFEGYDTTATAIIFIIMTIANHPEVQKKLQEELDRIFNLSERLPTTEDFYEMKYLECCIKESLRLYPSVPFIARFIKEEIILGGHTIPANTHANIMIYDLHHREDIYPQAEKFIPERFLPENYSKIHHFAFIPFSAGPRNCIGQKFAMLEMKIVLSGILRRYRLEPITKPSDIVFLSDLVLRTKDPIYVSFFKRS